MRENTYTTPTAKYKKLRSNLQIISTYNDSGYSFQELLEQVLVLSLKNSIVKFELK